MPTQEPKPWTRRPWPAHGDSDGDALYAAVGRALSQWERYESRLAILFSTFVSPFDSFAARRAYVAVRTFEGRAEMLRAASSAYFDSLPNVELLADFKMILASATSFSPRRNDIAHGVVDRYLGEEAWKEGRTGIFIGDDTFCLYPSWASFKDRDNHGVPSYCMTTNELVYFSEKFLDILSPVVFPTRKIGVIWNAQHASLYKSIQPSTE